MILAKSDPTPSLINTAVGEVAVTSEGADDALAVLCVHGIPGSSRDFRYLGPHLAQAFRMIRVEAPGFASAPRAASDAAVMRSIDGWAEMLHAVADALELPVFVVLGHSFGSVAALYAAALADGRAARVTGLVLVSGLGPRRHRGYFFPYWGYSAVGRALTLPLLRQLLAAIGRQAYKSLGVPPYERGDWRTLEHHMHLIGSVRFDRVTERLASLSCPTLLCHSVDDPLVQIAIARESAALIPNCRPLIFDDGGHYPQKHHAAAIAEAMREMFA